MPTTYELPDGRSFEVPEGTPIEDVISYAESMPKESGIKKYATPIRIGMETAGSWGGGLLGGAVGGPVGAVAGETAGYAGMSEAADYLLGEDTGGIGKKLAEGVAFSVVPRAVVGVASKGGRGMVRSALKIPPTQASRKSAEGAIDTIIKENLRVGQGGLDKATNAVKAIEGEIDSILDASTGKIQVSDIISSLDNLKQSDSIKYSSDPAAAAKIIDNLKNKVTSHPASQFGWMFADEAQKLKKGIYRELDRFYSNSQGLTPNKAIASNVESVGKAAWAESLKEQILKSPDIPAEVADKLSRESGILNAKRWIQRRANVAANMDPITFNDVLLGSLVREGVPAAVAMRALRSPAVQSQIGIYLTKSGVARKPMQYGGIAVTNLLNMEN